MTKAHITQLIVQKTIRWLGFVAPSLAAEIAVRLFTTPQPYDRPGWEKELIERARPLPLRSGLKAWSWGKPDHPAILLVHGWQGRGTQLGALIEPLVSHGFRVIALDGPAHGDSPGTRTSLAVYADGLVDLQKEHGSLCAVIAHSFGVGATAIALSRGLTLERVVLVASPSNYEWVVNNFCQRMQFSSDLRKTFSLKLDQWVGIPEKEIDIATLGKTARVPALIVHDPKDLDVPFWHSERILAAWPSTQPKARLLPIENVGHRRILKSPLFIDEVSRFLAHRSAADSLP